MKILIDQAMPYWHDFFSGEDNLLSFKAGDLALDDSLHIQNKKIASHLIDTECLLVRSTTVVNQDLLAKMPKLSFVATATAGYDHLDIEALKARKIQWYVAGGCNAQAVAQYVTCAILSLATQDIFLIKEKVIAIVGHGNVGRLIAKVLAALGATVIIYDPPQEAENQRDQNAVGKQNDHIGNSNLSYASFSDVLKADIICLHAPLDSHPEHPTKHMFSADVLSELSDKQYLINAGRGELIDNEALLSLFRFNEERSVRSVNVVLDVWENEPHISTALIPFLRLASAHIAGHTLEGKAKGTAMLYRQFCLLNEKKEHISLDDLLPHYDVLVPQAMKRAFQGVDALNEYEIQEILKQLCLFVYDIRNDDRVFRLHMSQFSSFATLRQEYPIRREFSALKLNIPNSKIDKMLRGIGFTV